MYIIIQITPNMMNYKNTNADQKRKINNNNHK